MNFLYRLYSAEGAEDFMGTLMNVLILYTVGVGSNVARKMKFKAFHRKVNRDQLLYLAK